MANKDWLKSVLVYLCITFFILTLVFIYMSLRGKPQAGLIEVIASSFLFVIFLYVSVTVLPSSSRLISTILSIVIALLLIYANYYLQIKENKDYSMREIMTGDLLARKFSGNKSSNNKIPRGNLANTMEPIDNMRTTTEKYTLESSFEKPRKMDLGDKSIRLTMDTALKKPAKAPIGNVLTSPLDLLVYKMHFLKPESIINRDDDKLLTGNMETFIAKIEIPSATLFAISGLPLSSAIDKLQPAVANKEVKADFMRNVETIAMSQERHILHPIGSQLASETQRP